MSIEHAIRINVLTSNLPKIVTHRQLLAQRVCHPQTDVFPSAIAGLQNAKPQFAHYLRKRFKFKTTSCRARIFHKYLLPARVTHTCIPLAI